MINFTTNQEYQGNNVDLLQGLGTEFCTFRQAVNFFGLTGKELRGAKSCARLMKVVDKEVIKNGKVEKKKDQFISTFLKRTIYYKLLKTINNNRGVYPPIFWEKTKCKNI